MHPMTAALLHRMRPCEIASRMPGYAPYEVQYGTGSFGHPGRVRQVRLHVEPQAGTDNKTGLGVR